MDKHCAYSVWCQARQTKGGAPQLKRKYPDGVFPDMFGWWRRPANHDQLDNNMLPIGVPSYMPSSEKSGRGLFFVSMHAMSPMATTASTCSTLSETYLRQVPFEGLELGTLLGKGGYGSVFRGRYLDQRCAVKVPLSLISWIPLLQLSCLTLAPTSVAQCVLSHPELFSQE